VLYYDFNFMRLFKYLLILIVLINYNLAKSDDRDNQLNRLFNELKINNLSFSLWYRGKNLANMEHSSN
jgi:hypothetical protein